MASGPNEEVKQRIEHEFGTTGTVVLDPANPNLTEEQKALVTKFQADEKKAGYAHPVPVVVYDSSTRFENKHLAGQSGDRPRASAELLSNGTDVILVSSSELKLIREDKDARQPVVDREAWVLEHEASHIHHGDNRRVLFHPRFPGDPEGAPGEEERVAGLKREQEFAADASATRESGKPQAGVEVLRQTQRESIKVYQESTPQEDDKRMQDKFSDHPPTGERIRRIENLHSNGGGSAADGRSITAEASNALPARIRQAVTETVKGTRRVLGLDKNDFAHGDTAPVGQDAPPDLAAVREAMTDVRGGIAGGEEAAAAHNNVPLNGAKASLNGPGVRKS